MHTSINKLIEIKNTIKKKKKDFNNVKIIAVSKTFPISSVLPIIEFGHRDFGENKVQEAVEKWSDIKIKNQNLKLHMIGKLQSNKVKFVVPLFDYIHSLDNLKLAEKISQEQFKKKKFLKIFIQVNIGNEDQKSGINPEYLKEFYKICVEKLKLNIIGLMCIPPQDKDVKNYFRQMKKLNDTLKLKELSMGMSADYDVAISYDATFVRIGTQIFGSRV